MRFDREPEAGPGLPGPLRAGGFIAPHLHLRKRKSERADRLVFLNVPWAPPTHVKFCFVRFLKGDTVIRKRRPLPLRQLRNFETVIKTLGGPARLAEELGKSASYVCNWRRENGKIPPKYYLEIRRLLAEQGFEPADHLFNFAHPVRRRRRVTYCDFAESNVIFFDFRRRA